MRTFLASLSVSVAIATAAFASDGWFTFTPPWGGFSMSVPATPKIATETVKVADGGNIGTAEYTVDRRTLVLLAMVSDFNRYPKAIPSKVIDGAARGAKASAVAVLSDAPANRDGLAGREIRTVDKDGNLTDDNIFFVGHRLYQFMTVLAPNPSAATIADAKRFAGGFHFIKR